MCFKNWFKAPDPQPTTPILEVYELYQGFGIKKKGDKNWLKRVGYSAGSITYVTQRRYAETMVSEDHLWNQHRYKAYFFDENVNNHYSVATFDKMDEAIDVAKRIEAELGAEYVAQRQRIEEAERKAAFVPKKVWR